MTSRCLMRPVLPHALSRALCHPPRRTAATAWGSFLPQLEARGLVQAQTGLPGELQTHLASGARVVYCGFDPTAASLHVGNLVSILGLVHAARCGHRIIALVGGATGRIGDPSGRSSERPVMSTATLAANIHGIRATLERCLRHGLQYDAAQDLDRGAGHGSAASVEMVDNADFYTSMTVLDFVASVGKHFRMHTMLGKESVRARLASEDGMSFTEFSYQLFQAYDFSELYRRHGCTLQLGGSDQWGNITAGTELVRRVHQASCFGLTLPLLTTSTGEKFGKSAGNAVWLDEAMTSAYQLYQFFVNVADTDVERYLLVLTLLTPDQIAQAREDTHVVAAHRLEPEARGAQHRLAAEVVGLVHGRAAVERALAATAALHGHGDLGLLSKQDLTQALADVPTVRLPLARLAETTVLDGLLLTKLASSKGDAKRLFQAGGFSINNARLTELPRALRPEDALHGTYTVLRRGKKATAVLCWEEVMSS